MEHLVNKSHYDLEDRTLTFAKDVRKLIKQIPKHLENYDDLKQLIRSSGSIGANYREANEALSKRDFIMRAKIFRKEAKETVYWLQLLSIEDQALKTVQIALIKEATELMKIFGAIITKSE